MPRVIPPRPGHDDRFFWDGVVRSKLFVHACADCGRRQHPPSPMCPACGSVRWHEEELSGRGTVYSWIVSHHPTEPDDTPRIVVLVQLDEEVRMVSNLQGTEPHEVHNDLVVEAVFVDVDGVQLPQFRPVRE